MKTKFLSLLLLGLVCSIGSVWGADLVVSNTTEVSETFADGSILYSIDSNGRVSSSTAFGSGKDIVSNGSKTKGAALAAQRFAIKFPVAVSGVTIYGYNSSSGRTLNKISTSTTMEKSSYTEITSSTTKNSSSTTPNYSYTFTASWESPIDANTAIWFEFSNSCNFYKVSYTPASITPSISADNVNLAASATGGNIAYSITNPVEGGTVTAAKKGVADWLLTVGNGDSPIAFTTTANTGAERSATVTLTYTYNTDQTVTKDVTITQAAKTYSITYSAGTGASGSIEAGVKSHGVDFTLSSETFTRSGFAQIGWATSDGGTKAYDLGGTYAENADIELFPAWIEGSSYTFDYSDAKTISQLKALGWDFNSDEFDADPADGEAYVNLVSAMNDEGLTAPKSNSMEDNAIAFAKTPSAYAIYDLGDEYNIYSVSATLYGGSSSGFDQHIKYLGSDGFTVILDKTNNLKAGNWKANSLSYSDAVSGVRYIAIYGATKWVVMTNFTVVYGNMYQESSVSADAWTTFSPSFDVNIPSGVTAYKLAYAGGESATASPISETKIKAAEGVLLKASEAGVYQFVKTTGATELDDNILKGTTERTLVYSLKTEDNFYAFDKTDSKFKLYTGEYFPANKAYFETGESLAPSAIRIDLEESNATDIKSVEEKETAVKFFDGGRILIMKNGVVYDALGRVIR